MKKYGELLTAMVLLVVVWLCHSISPNAASLDSRWTVFTALSIIREGNTDLDEYLPFIERADFYGIECVAADGTRRYPIKDRSECADGRLHNRYPIAVAALATPMVAATDYGIRAAQPLLRPLADRMPTDARRSLLLGDLANSSAAVEVLLASFIIALATVLMYFIGREFLDRRKAVLVGLIFAFCTPAWSTASRGLWQHGPSMLLLAAALLLVLRAERTPGLICLAGIPLVVAFFVRPTNVIPLVVFTVFVWCYYRKRFVSYLLCAAPVAAPFLAHSYVVYGTMFAPYASIDRLNIAWLAFHDAIGEAMCGNLISPARGLFVYVPLFLLSVYGMAIRPRRSAERINPFLVAVIMLHWVLISLFDVWWGGHCYGPRHFSDMAPFLVYFLIPVLDFAGLLAAARRFVLPVTFAVLMAVSFWIHLQGATEWACYEWNMVPTDVNASSTRIWDWGDPAFLRGVRD